MKKYIVLNLKMNGSRELISRYSGFSGIKSGNNFEVIIAPPHAYLQHARKLFDFSISVAAQDVCNHENGEFTGQISASMAKDLACSHVILGHSEARTYLHQTNDEIAQKISLVHKNNLTSILCIGESLGDKNEGSDACYAKLIEQLKVIPDSANIQNTIIAYEPIWAIGTGKTPSLDEILESVTIIKEYLKSQNLSNLLILYGGSVNTNNALDILDICGLSGILIGKMSLKIDDVKWLLTQLS